jgi:hypothetical protein
MRAPAKSVGSLKPLFRSAFRRRREPDWRPDLVSPEERIAAVLIVVLLATLVAAACAVYVPTATKRVPPQAQTGAYPLPWERAPQRPPVTLCPKARRLSEAMTGAQQEAFGRPARARRQE